VDRVEAVLRSNPGTLEWVVNQWVHVVVRHADTGACFRWEGNGFEPYTPMPSALESVPNWQSAFEGRRDLIEVKARITAAS